MPHIPTGQIWNLGRRVFMGRLIVQVRAHEALLLPQNIPAVFINVTNLSPRRSVRPTHVTVRTNPPLAIVNTQRPFRTLAPDGDSWETWVVKADLPDPNDDVRGLIEVRFSSGLTITATPVTPGIELPEAGAIPS